MKIIVTHKSPDLDAIVATWLIRKFWPEFKSAEIEFVPAGNSYQNKIVDADKNIIHVDTGNGKFDHHQVNEFTCSSEKVYFFLLSKKYIKYKYHYPLKRIINLVNKIDHFHDIYYQDCHDDIYDLNIDKIIEGLKYVAWDDKQLITTSFLMLDSLLVYFVSKIDAESDIKKGFEFKSRWGKALAVKSNNNLLSKIAQRQGYNLVIQKYPKSDYVKIKIRPDCKKTLKLLYKHLIDADSKATWYYHISNHMILNGVMSDPRQKSSKLSLNQLISIAKSIKK